MYYGMEYDKLKEENDYLKKKIDEVVENWFKFFTGDDKSYMKTLCTLYRLSDHNIELKRQFRKLLSNIDDPKLEQCIGTTGILYFYNDSDDSDDSNDSDKKDIKN